MIMHQLNDSKMSTANPKNKKETLTGFEPGTLPKKPEVLTNWAKWPPERFSLRMAWKVRFANFYNAIWTWSHDHAMRKLTSNLQKFNFWCILIFKLDSPYAAADEFITRKQSACEIVVVKVFHSPVAVGWGLKLFWIKSLQLFLEICLVNFHVTSPCGFSH